MRIRTVVFAAGVWAFQQSQGLPPPALLHAGALVWLALVLFALLVRWRRPVAGWRAGCIPFLLVLLAFAAGWLWAGLRAEWRLADALPAALEGEDLVVVGRVADLPQPFARGVRFGFELDPVQPEGVAAGAPRRLALSWYAARDGEQAMPQVRAGERWRFVVRLKRPHGLANPHGFDYEAWLLERGIRATGYVRGEAVRLDAEPAGALQWLHLRRGEVRERLLAVLGERPYAGIVVALAVGDQRAITPAQWEVFRRTGVNHLVAISGLHVSLVALVAGIVCGGLWRRVPAFSLRLAALRMAALAGLIAATAYAMLAGLGIPVQRALLMLAAAALALLAGREPGPGRILAFALGAVLVVDPWAVLAAGFWLSFAAVGVILHLLAGRHGVGRSQGWRIALKIQLALQFALVPALLLLFHAFSLVSLPANLVAIPLVSYVVTPLVLLGVVLPVDSLLVLAHACLGAMMAWLEWLAGFERAVWQQAAPPAWLVLAGAAAVGLLLLPRGTPGRPAALVVLVLLFGWPAPRPAAGSFRATVLDVGQGLAVHVQTARHDLLYDAGPPYGPSADAGARVVLPWFAANGVERLDRLLLSHDDADHVGGAGAVLAGVDTGEVFAGGTTPAGAEGRPLHACRVDERWAWDGVEFALLHPDDEGDARRDNDQSCVLRVAAPGGSLLLVGDLGSAGEAAMLARQGAAALASSVVVVGHHGSRTSSSPAFVDAVRAEAAIHSAGYRNPFGHPHPAVWARWAEAGARNWRTDSQGAILVEVGADGVALSAARERAPRYWHGR
ncbi:DNA internalization-related competence protein ComEC/Rec2 [Thauera phenolivorans]|uniref:DNA internalization-related competence protein ComEC/Rec2 n=1 Tax=Thauera phenolivorans TaxID=1792543 RepID=UPI000839D87F|nr:DNA internalization-related competence protein ComEC/Rec2 [Thauera phenolivorans]